MARDKVGGANADKVEDEAGTGGPAKQAAGEKAAAGKSDPHKDARGKDAPGKDTPETSAAEKRTPRAESSLTARQAAAARAALQRGHRRIEFARAVAFGAEFAGAAGLVVAGLLAWEWTDRLWGRTDGLALTVQVSTAVTVAALIAAWVLRSDRWRTAARGLAVVAAAVTTVLSIASVWQVAAGGRGGGGLVAAVAGLLVIAGASGWLAGLRRLRKLFAFGVRYARTGGYGNLSAVRRAQYLGAPLGALGAAAVVAGGILVAPGLVGSEDSQTAEALTLTGATPSIGTKPTWEIELPAGLGRTTVRATPGGLAVDEQRGVRMVDPASGETRWHWRDEAYTRVAVNLTDSGRILLLGLTHDGEEPGRNRIVALDTATGQVRWQRFDDDLVAQMALLGVAPEDGAWLAAPGRLEPATDPTANETPYGVRLVDATDGDAVWLDPGTEGCTVASLGAGSSDVVLVVEDCGVPEGVDTGVARCQVSGLAVEDGRRLWTWPDTARIDPEQHYAVNCRATSLDGRIFLTFQANSLDPEAGDADVPTPALALHPITGEELWAVEQDEDGYAVLGVDGLNNPVDMAGDLVVGVEYPSNQVGVGTAVLIMRDATDGSRVSEIALPEGQPVGLRATDDDRLMISHYLREADQIKLLEVDLAKGAVVTEAEVATGSEEAQFRSAGVAVGPEAVAVDTLVVSGPNPQPGEVRLIVRGFS